MKIEMWTIGRVKPYERNPRKNDSAVDAVAASIAEFGFRVPIVVDDQGVIIAGHTRLKAAEKLGLAKVPVHIAKGLTPAQVRGLRIADNKLHELSAWDMDLLPLELADLQGMDFDLSLLGFDSDELRELLQTGARVDGALDEVPEPLPEAVSRVGDLWLLGEHRLLCGDSTKWDDVERVMAGERADLLLTDPPYGVAYQSKLSVEEAIALHRRRDGLEVANDALSPEATRKLVCGALVLAADSMRAGAVFYVCSPSGDMSDVIRAACVGAGLAYRQVLVWAKDVFVMGRQDYHWRHEDILYGWKEGAGHYFVDDRTQDTVWECERPKRSEAHPTMKPVALFARAISNSTRRGDVAYEPFSGSGTTIVACEQLGRRCRAIELEPRYVDVAVRRWEQLTGNEAVLEGDGRSFAKITAERLPASKKAPEMSGAEGLTDGR